MSFGKKLKHLGQRFFRNGLSRKQWKSVRKKLGLTSKNKFMRQLKRSFSGSKMFSTYQQPNSASSVGYQHQSRTLSQLTGGV